MVTQRPTKLAWLFFIHTVEEGKVTGPSRYSVHIIYTLSKIAPLFVIF